MSETVSNQDTTIPTVLPGVAFRVIAGTEHVHLERNGESVAAFSPAEARRLAALLLGAAFALDEPGTVGDVQGLIDLVRVHDAALAVLQDLPDETPRH